MPIGSVLLTVTLLVAVAPDEPAGAVNGAAPLPDAPVVSSPASATAVATPVATPAGGYVSPYRMVWGVIDTKVFPDANRMAPNGEPYNPIFSLDLDINIWLWPEHGLYLFGESRFWGQRGTPGQTHGNFDYTKREFDITAGAAWNYWDALEFRAGGYAFNNLNRGNSLTVPSGYNDGLSLENRLYLSGEYARLGQDGFNVSRADFVSLGCLPNGYITGLDGNLFKAGLFARTYLTWDIPATCCYVYVDAEIICEKTYEPRLLQADTGLAIVPFERLRMLEFRLGSEFVVDFRTTPIRNNNLPYFSVRLNY